MIKVTCLYNLINQRCLRFYSKSSFICVDESMLPYYGQHSSKQRIAGRPLGMGYNGWVLAQSNGCALQFEAYKRAIKKNLTWRSATSWGLSEKAVVQLTCPLPINGTYHIFCDNFFPSLGLFCRLHDQDVKITGTIRSSRLKNVQFLIQSS